MRSSQRAESSSSSSSENSIHEHTRPEHILKPPKYDGAGSFETFLAQFQNCASNNKWTKREQLVYLRSSLEKSAGQVLWDYSAETTGSLSKMIKILKERFGEANQSNKYRLELKSRRRRPNETPRNLQSDIPQLAALALRELEHGVRETVAWDYFIEALDDANFALKVRKRSPKDLDSALRVALQLEVWSRDVEQSSRRKRRAREIKEPEKEQADQRAQETSCRATEAAYGAAEKGPDNGAQQASRRARSSTDRGKDLRNDRSSSRSRSKHRSTTNNYRSDWTANDLLGMRSSRRSALGLHEALQC